MSTEEIKGLIDQTAAWGVEVFNPLGGEPFLRTDLEQILAYAVRRGFYVTITTNGTLISERRARALAAIPSDRLHFNISLDGRRDSNDQIRGSGNWDRAIKGFERIRAADRAAGNSRRKILANTILHAGNLDHFESVLDEQATLGFDGVQILNLFRPGQDVPSEASNLWLRERHMPDLEALCARLANRAKMQTLGGYRIQNSPEELRMLPGYYRDELKPLDAPCWAGWKELYINADGQAIMCDGNLDFLAGEFGSVREKTLRQLWDSPELAARRRVTRSCTTPCVQKCYLRPESDSAMDIVRDGLQRVDNAVRQRLRGFRSTVDHQPHVVLRCELSDVYLPGPMGHDQERWAFLTGDCVEPPTPESWHRDRDHGLLNFGRGFMGFELLREVVSDLRSQRLRVGCLDLSWRGEPLIHPEILPIFRYLAEQHRAHGLFDCLRIRTDGRHLDADLIDALNDTPVVWEIDLDRGNGAGLSLLKELRGPRHRILALIRVSDGLDVQETCLRWPDFPPAVGRRPSMGDALWFCRQDADHYQENAESRVRLERAAGVLNLPVESGDENRPRYCSAPERTPVISWDGKIVLCPWDVQMENRVGDIGDQSFSSSWSGRGFEEARNECSARGVPDRDLCRNCPMPWSPNHGD